MRQPTTVLKGKQQSPGVWGQKQKGQTLVIVGLMMTLLMLFIGLGIDAGNLMGRRAKLQSAVDSAALSAAEELLAGSTVTQTATTKAYQILEANGVASNTLSLRLVDFPSGGNQVHVRTIQRVDTFFMSLVPSFRQMDISAEATADINAYAEISTKPYGQPGVVNELNLMTWGTDSWRKGGDAYSPVYIDNSAALNPWHSMQPYGYLYRIDVPSTYTYTHLLVEIFDPDCYNRPDYPTAWPTPYPCPGPQCGSPTPTPSASQYASCTNPRPGACTTNDARYNTGMKLNAFPNGRPAFWRVDEFRNPYYASDINPTAYANSQATTTQYTLWHFSPHITTAFDDPANLSDQPNNAYLARYTVGSDATTDLSWYHPSSFNIQLTGCAGGDCFEREATGGMYFYLYVQGIAGSSENNFDLRVGSPDANGGGCSTPCNVDSQYASGAADWQDGGAKIFAKRALPLNLDTGASFPLVFTQINKSAAGQTLGVRHFDQDCNNGCGSTMDYQMLKCNADPALDASWEHIANGYVGPDNGWVSGSNPDPEPVQLPVEGTSLYTDFFGNNGQCQTSWLRIRSNPSYSQDTTVWEMPFIRPRLVK